MQPTNQQTSNHANNEASKQRRNQDICHSLYKHIVCFSSTWPVAKPCTILFVFVTFTGPPPAPFPDNWRSCWHLCRLVHREQVDPRNHGQASRNNSKMSCGENTLDIFHCTRLLPNSFGKSIRLAVLWRLQKSASSNHKKRFHLKSAKSVSQEFSLIF